MLDDLNGSPKLVEGQFEAALIEKDEYKDFLMDLIANADMFEFVREMRRYGHNPDFLMEIEGWVIKTMRLEIDENLEYSILREAINYVTEM